MKRYSVGRQRIVGKSTVPTDKGDVSKSSFIFNSLNLFLLWQVLCFQLFFQCCWMYHSTAQGIWISIILLSQKTVRKTEQKKKNQPLSRQLSKQREGAGYTKAVSLIHFGCLVLIAKNNYCSYRRWFHRVLWCYESTNKEATDPECRHALKVYRATKSLSGRDRPINLSGHGAMMSESLTLSGRKTHITLAHRVQKQKHSRSSDHEHNAGGTVVVKEGPRTNTEIPSALPLCSAPHHGLVLKPHQHTIKLSCVLLSCKNTEGCDSVIKRETGWGRGKRETYEEVEELLFCSVRREK